MVRLRSGNGNKSATVYTARDQQIHEALALTPLDTQQLLEAQRDL